MTSSLGQWIHMVGIAGAGMSGIAKVLSEQGYRVSGSDIQSNNTTRYLEEIGVKIFEGHSANNLEEGIELIVISSAIPADNPEVERAIKLNIPVIKRGQMLAKIVNQKKGIAIAGAHGKTTTTAMLYIVLEGCEVQPSFIVGGELQGTQLNAQLGTSDYFVVEADESDASFLEIRPYIAIVTNIEDDHLDYYHSFDKLRNAFQQFLEQVQPGGFSVIYGGDDTIQTMLNDLSGKNIIYGEMDSADYCLKNWRTKDKGSVYDVYAYGKFLGEVEISVPGKHNALNSLAAIATSLELGLDFDKIRTSLKRFAGTNRRFQTVGEIKGITIVDDYAHHPTEIIATLDAARGIHSGRIIALFQPHRYSRTKLLGKQFGESFHQADLVIISDIYAAGESPISGVSSEIIYETAIKSGIKALLIPDCNNNLKQIIDELEVGDLIITMGAGDIWKTGVNLMELLVAEGNF